jgi:PAS domain S-box-containing protein
MDSDRQPGALAPPPAGPPSRWVPLALFALVGGVVAVGGVAAWRDAERRTAEGRARAIASVVALKVEQVVRWRDERLSDAESLAQDPELAGALGRPPADGVPADVELGAFFEHLRRIGDYTGVALLDPAGDVAFSVGRLEPAHPALQALFERALSERRTAMSELHGSGGAPPHLDVVAPVEGPEGAVGAVLLRVDPRPYLFRVVATWHEPTRSAEVLLLQADGAGAEALNAGSGAATARYGPETPIARAMAGGARAALEAIDHRGVEVIAAVEPVPGSTWALLAKEDAADVSAPVRQRAAMIAVAFVGLLIGAGALLAVGARRQSDRLAAAAAERAALARRLARLTARAQDMVLVADDAQRLIEVNDRAVELLGYARDELLGMDVRALRDPATVDDFPERVREQVDQGVAMFETRYRRKDGSTFPVAVSVHIDEHDGKRWFEAIARDISDRKRAEEALRESEAKFRAGFEFASLGVLLVAPDGRMIEANGAVRAITGFSEDDLRGAPVALLHDPADIDTPADVLLARMARGEADRIELPRRIRRKDGTLAETIVRARALRDGAGRLRLVVAVVEDVSEKKRLEAQLLLADRMASVGTLAAGVAHEINNPLAFILSNLEFLAEELRRTSPDPEMLRALDDAMDGAARVREIVRDLKTFSRPVDEVREAVDVRAVLRSAIGLASNEIRHRAQLVVEPGDVPRVAASEYRLGQVFLNLLVNAAQAIPEGHAAEHVVRAATSTGPDGRAVVEISDTGAGIPPEILPRIFDPFFTTKPVGVGTGLGLSICHGIVTQLGGDISVESAPGKGSTFRVVLPGAAAASAAAASPRPPPAPARRTRILVVDDEPLVGRAVGRILASEHEVVFRTSARDALGELLGTPGFDLVVCDLMMPDMTGMDLHERLARDAPALAARTVFLTGGAFTAAARDFLERVPNLRLEKPFDPQELRDLVARALSAAAAEAAVARA